VIRDYKLVVIVNLLLVIDLVILTTWQIVDPPFRVVKELLPQVSQHNFIILTPIKISNPTEKLWSPKKNS